MQNNKEINTSNEQILVFNQTDGNVCLIDLIEKKVIEINDKGFAGIIKYKNKDFVMVNEHKIFKLYSLNERKIMFVLEIKSKGRYFDFLKENEDKLLVYLNEVRKSGKVVLKRIKINLEALYIEIEKRNK